MDENEYIANIQLLTHLCRTLILVPLEEMQQANEHTQALAPILEPTAFHRGGGRNLTEQREIIDAALTLKRACLRLHPEVLEPTT